MDSLCCVVSCLALAVFLLPSISIVKGGIHHGGNECGLIVSIVIACCGKNLARFSSGVMWFLLCDVLALRIAALMGCVSGAVRILVHDWSTLFLRRRCAGGRDVSICNAEVAVVRKVTRIAFIAVLCADSIFVVDAPDSASPFFEGFVPYESILGVTTDVNNVRVCWYAALHVCLAILDIVRAKLVPFFDAS